MKKFLFAVGLVVILCSGMKWWADLNVNGSIIKTDPTYTGTLTIAHSANNQIDFSSSAIGPFMRVAVGNQVDFLNQAVFSTFRGGYFSATIGGNVNAFATGVGNVGLNQVSGRTYVGSNVVDDGFSQLIVKGDLKIDSLRGLGGNTGDILTKNAAGYFVPQTPTQNVSAQEYTPTLSNIQNCSNMVLEEASYTQVGKIIHVKISGTFSPIAGGGTRSKIGFTLPAVAASAGAYYDGSGMAIDNATNFLIGFVQRNSSSVDYFAVNSMTSFATTIFVCELTYKAL